MSNGTSKNFAGFLKVFIILTQSCVKKENIDEVNVMENIIAVFVAILFLAGILLFAKKFLKAPKGKLPDCFGPRGNRDIEV